MGYEQKDNSGILFNNDRKESDRHPDRNGNAMIDGVEYWISGWVKKGAKGPFMSLSFKRKDFAQKAQSSGAHNKPAPGRANADMGGDDIPFAPEFR